MASTTELDALFKRMSQGDVKKSDIIRTSKGRVLYKVYNNNMTGGGPKPMTVSPVEQSIQQAKRLSKLKRGRSSSTSHSSSGRPKKRRRRKTSSSVSKKKKRTTKKKKKLSKTKTSKGRKKSKTLKRKLGRKRTQKRKRRAKDALD